MTHEERRLNINFYKEFVRNTFEQVGEEMVKIGATKTGFRISTFVVQLRVIHSSAGVDARTLELAYWQETNRIELWLTSMERREKLADTAETVFRTWRLWYPIIREAIQ